MVPKKYPFFIFTALIIVLLLSGCGDPYSESQASLIPGSESPLPEWLKLSHRIEKSSTWDEVGDIYEVEVTEDPEEIEQNDNNSEETADNNAGQAPATNPTPGASTRAEEQDSKPEVPQQSVGSTWYDIMPSDGSGRNSGDGFTHEVNLSEDD